MYLSSGVIKIESKIHDSSRVHLFSKSYTFLHVCNHHTILKMFYKLDNLFSYFLTRKAKDPHGGDLSISASFFPCWQFGPFRRPLTMDSAGASYVVALKASGVSFPAPREGCDRSFSKRRSKSVPKMCNFHKDRLWLACHARLPLITGNGSPFPFCVVEGSGRARGLHI